MTTEEFRRLVARVTYKPGWAVTAIDDPILGAVVIRVAFTVPDATLESEQPLPLRIKYALPAALLVDMDERRALAYVFERVMEMERHEAREWFKLDGVPVDYPHGPDPRGELLP